MDINALPEATGMAVQGMATARRLRLTYHPTDTAKDEHRVVEVHAVGVGRKGKLCLRVFQTSGSSVYSDESGWKMLLFEDADDVHLTDEVSLAPRSGYKMGDRGMSSVLKEIDHEPPQK